MEKEGETHLYLNAEGAASGGKKGTDEFDDLLDFGPTVSTGLEGDWLD